jgi:hypothetical protein
MAKNTIKVKKYGDHIEEITSGGVITPGMLIAEGSAGTVAVHSTAGGAVIPMFALEDELQGKGVDDNYASGAKVQCWYPYRGDQVYALLADGETAVVGSLLESNGDGYLKVYAADSAGVAEAPLSIVAQATEALDMSDSSGADPSSQRIIVRIV